MLSAIAIVLCFCWKWWVGVIALLCLHAYGAFRLFSMGLEQAFRNKYPDEFIGHIRWLIDYFYEKGYCRKEILDEGSSHPKYIMTNKNHSIIITLNAPLSKEQKDWTIEVSLSDSDKITLSFDCDIPKVYNDLDTYFETKMYNNGNVVIQS